MLHENVSQAFFSSLQEDWFNPKQVFYNLKEKLTEENFSKLLEIGEKGTFVIVCLRICYQYFNEIDAKIDDCTNLSGLGKIDKILAIRNKTLKFDLLKLIVVHWSTEESHELPKNYEETKENILKISELSEVDKSFFEMAFTLHENDSSKFEFELKDFKNLVMEKVGDFHEYLMSFNLQLLLVIMKRKKMFKTIDFTFVMCPFLKHNSKVIDIMKRTQDYQQFIVESSRFAKYLVSLKIENLICL